MRDFFVDEASIISDSAEIYFRADINNSMLEEKVVVGELSRVKNSVLGRMVKIGRYNLIKECRIGNYTYTGSFDKIFHAFIGRFCSISYGVTIAPPEHDYSRITTHPFIRKDSGFDIFDDDECLPIDKFDKKSQIGNDVWIGCNSTILRGVTVGDGAVVAANALVIWMAAA